MTWSADRCPRSDLNARPQERFCPSKAHRLLGAHRDKKTGGTVCFGFLHHILPRTSTNSEIPRRSIVRPISGTSRQLTETISGFSPDVSLSSDPLFTQINWHRRRRHQINTRLLPKDDWYRLKFIRIFNKSNSLGKHNSPRNKKGPPSEYTCQIMLLNVLVSVTVVARRSVDAFWRISMTCWIC